MFLHENFGTVKFWYCLCNCICYLPSALPSNKVTWLMWSYEIHGKFKPLYFYYHTAFGHQNWQDDDFPGFIQSFDHVKTIISPPPQILWLPSLAVLWFTLRGSFPLSYRTLRLHGLVGSPDKLKSLYLHCHNA